MAEWLKRSLDVGRGYVALWVGAWQAGVRRLSILAGPAGLGPADILLSEVQGTPPEGQAPRVGSRCAWPELPERLYRAGPTDDSAP